MEMKERVQTVLFMRHGVARHNLRDPQTGQPANHHDPSMVDPPLVYEGHVGAIQAGNNIRVLIKAAPSPFAFELIVASPLTRCMQTAVLAFLPGDDYCDRNPPPPRTPILCKEDLREAFGIFFPDRRREKSLLMVRYRQ